MASTTSTPLLRTHKPRRVLDGRYEIDGVLGYGGFATVYRGRHLRMGRMVAIKVLDYQGEDGNVARMVAEKFLLEAKAIARVSHPNVVRIFDFGLTGSRRPYIVMELLEGHDLGDLLDAGGPMAVSRVQKLFLPTLRALAQVHRAGIVHRDLKPANLFVTQPGTRRERMTILDFGVASIRAEHERRITSHGHLLGTPSYLAPEYIRDNIVLPTLDVYQIAMVYIEVLSGDQLVKSSDPVVCQRLHTEGRLSVPVDLFQGPLGPVMSKALSLDHRHRYQDAGSFLNALEAVDILGVTQPGPERMELWKLIKDTGEEAQTFQPTVRLDKEASAFQPPPIPESVRQPALVEVAPLRSLGGGNEDEASTQEDFDESWVDSLDEMETTMWTSEQLIEAGLRDDGAPGPREVPSIGTGLERKILMVIAIAVFGLTFVALVLLLFL